MSAKLRASSSSSEVPSLYEEENQVPDALFPRVLTRPISVSSLSLMACEVSISGALIRRRFVDEDEVAIPLPFSA